MPLDPTLFLAPSISAAQTLSRRLARVQGAHAALWTMRPIDLAERIATAPCLARGLKPWGSGHAALLVEQLLATLTVAGAHPFLPDGLPPGPAARVLSRTIEDLRGAGLRPVVLRSLACSKSYSADDRTRLQALADVYERYLARVAPFFDRTELFTEATRIARGRESSFLATHRVLLSPDLEPRSDELAFLCSLATTTSVCHVASKHVSPEVTRAYERAGIREIPWSETPFRGIVTPSSRPFPPSRVGDALFGAPDGIPHDDRESPVSFKTAPGESAEIRSLARAILRAAREGVPFDEMALVIPQPEVYAPIVADTFSRASIPYRLHPSLPLSFGRIARSFLLLLRSRDFDRGTLMEFLTFAPVPLAERLGVSSVPHPSTFDALSRDLKIVSGAHRFERAVLHFIQEETDSLAKHGGDTNSIRFKARKTRIDEAHAFLSVLAALQSTFVPLAQSATFEEWSKHLLTLLSDWIRPQDAIEAEEWAVVRDVLEDIGLLSSISKTVGFETIERIVQSRFEWKRQPLEARSRVGVHVGSPEALSGAKFRLVMVVGLVEGRYPGVFRPDPFLLDREREELTKLALESDASTAKSAKVGEGQLSLFDASDDAGDGDIDGSSFHSPHLLEATSTRVRAARRAFARLFSMADERVVLSYPRADEQTGRERLPSLFYVAAAQAALGRSLTASELSSLVEEEDTTPHDLDMSIDLAERDMAALHLHGLPVLSRIELDRPFLKAARSLARARASKRFTPWDGHVSSTSAEDARILERLDPVAAPTPMSASRLGTFGECGYRYFLQHVLKLERAIEPEERRRLDPLERGTLFHEVAELFLRSRRDRGLLPIKNTDEEREELRELATHQLERWVEGSPPRLVLLWRVEKRIFIDLLEAWLKREAIALKPPSVPAHFEVAFGLGERTGDTAEPHRVTPVEIPLADGRRLMISGKIDRIDRIAPEDGGGLIVRDYKTGRAPFGQTPADVGFLKGGRQLQIPFYVLAAKEIFPDEPVRQAFLDYVNGGRPVTMSPQLPFAPSFRALLLEIVNLIRDGVFVQDSSACTFCDFKPVCGPKNLMDQRLRAKQHDPLLQRVTSVKRLS